MSETTADRIRAIIVEHLCVEAEKVVPEALLVPEHDLASRIIPSSRPDLGADSLDVVELVMALENEFRIEIPDDEAETLNTGTVADLISLVESKLTA